jgi:MFS family permease
LYLNIVGEVYKSFNVTEMSALTYVITSSLSNAAGRLIMGVMTDLKPASIPAVALLLPCITLVTIGHGMLIFTTNFVVLFIATILTGLSYGGQFAIVPVVLNRYFGDRHYGTNVGIQALSVAFGSLIMGFFSGKMYDANAGLDPEGHADVCSGLRCYMGTFIMTAVVALVAHFFVIFLVRREKKFDARLKSVDGHDDTA